MFNRKVKLAQTQESFDYQVDAFLIENGFEQSLEDRRLFATLIQHSPEDSDTYEPRLMAARMRKQKANQLAFYVIYPNKRPTQEVSTPDAPPTTEPGLP